MPRRADSVIDGTNVNGLGPGLTLEDGTASIANSRFSGASTVNVVSQEASGPVVWASDALGPAPLRLENVTFASNNDVCASVGVNATAPAAVYATPTLFVANIVDNDPTEDGRSFLCAAAAPDLGIADGARSATLTAAPAGVFATPRDFASLRRVRQRC